MSYIDLDGELYFMIPGQKFVPIRRYVDSINGLYVGQYVKGIDWFVNEYHLPSILQIKEFRHIKYSKNSRTYYPQMRVYGYDKWFHVSHVEPL